MPDQDLKLAWILALADEPEATCVAETHGLVVGLLSAKPALNKDQLITHLAALQTGDWDSDELNQQTEPALKAMRDELDASEMSFRPLLPTDERPLDERTGCLAHWCSGFLSGFGAGEPTIAPGEATEAVHLLEQIARATTEPEADDEVEESAYAELVEFVRMATLLLREHSRESAA
ncbi:MAG: UPF0149 family protein [Wenzhouxiangella sp.]|jgi:uncharacterized protein YgfB (UPF0149 family)|nr:UPF0149 family protein [Wenzhouxiangella sp.]